MATARVAEPSGSLQEVKEWGLDREDLLGIYRDMITTRGVEERGHILYRQGKIPGSFYTGRGNEAASVAVARSVVVALARTVAVIPATPLKSDAAPEPISLAGVQSELVGAL